jgi:hypothetical protein
MEELTDRSTRQEAVRYFIDQVGIEVEALAVARGSMCDGRAMFAISLGDKKFRTPFFVEIDLKTHQKILMRPE